MDAVTQDILELSGQDIGEQYLTFNLGDEEYAVEILKVQEIKSWTPATPIPCAPDYLLGVVNLRGSIVPVIDLRRRFGMKAKEFTVTTAIVIVRVSGEDEGDKIAGLVVDKVADVYHLGASKIQDSADIASSIDRDYILGLAQEDDSLIILINLEKIVASSLELLDLGED